MRRDRRSQSTWISHLLSPDALDTDFSSSHWISNSPPKFARRIVLSGLEIAALVVDAVSAGAGAGAISAFRVAKELNGRRHMMEQVNYTGRKRGFIPQSS